MDIQERIRAITSKKAPRKLTHKERNELRQTIKLLENLLETVAEADDPSVAFDELFPAFEDSIEYPFYDFGNIEQTLEDWDYGKITTQAAAYKIAMETTGLAVLQRL